ncbi:hypothetical protein [Carboxylicivirga sp. RSCT41]|uniref:hypothetical protein n=1 Tax=Carboxylicivirga agarovorans TaxID=3417570 RepID=UPI003D328196
MKRIVVVLLTALALNVVAKAEVYPVYFADVIKEGKNTTLHFEWRPDFKNYDKAIITNENNKVVGELKYPDNHFSIKKPNGYKNLFVTAVCMNGEKSEAVKVEINKDYSNLVVTAPAEQIVIKKGKGKNACFVGAQSGKEFIAKGVNFCGIRTGDHDSFEPTFKVRKAHLNFQKASKGNPTFVLHDIEIGQELICYDPYRSETFMRTIKANGFNIARVFIKLGERGSKQSDVRGLSGTRDTKGISAAYMDNFIDFLTRAQKYGIYVMPCFTENEMLDNDYFRQISKGATRQAILFSEDGIKAKQHYIELFLKYIKEKDASLISSLFALTMQNEFAWHSNEAPFNQTKGTYTFIDGSEYDMTDDNERRALANAAIQNYMSKMKEAVEANAPGMLIGEGTFSMGGVGKTYDNSKGIRTIEGNNDIRFPMTAVEYLNTDIDFLDFHLYRWGAKGTGQDVFNHFAENMKLFTPEAKELMKSKPIIMGEFGSFKENEATLDEAIVFVQELEKAAMDFGFKGSLYWTIDTFVQTRLWNLMWEDGQMLKAFKE